MEEKELIEKRNAKVAEMENILNKAKKAVRAVTNEEKTAIEDLEKEVKDIDDTLEKIEKLNNIAMKEVKPVVTDSVEDKEYKIFENMIRKGVFNTDEPTTRSDGSATIPTTIANRIIDRIVQICPIYQMAEHYEVSGDLDLPRYDKDNSSIVMNYADEGTTAESGKAKFAKITLTEYLGRCLAKVSKSLINNSKFDIVAFVIEKVSQAISVFIEKELLYGTSSKIEGLSGITDSSMIVQTASSSAITMDNLIDLQECVIDTHQSNAIWIMNRSTRKAIRKLKDNDGNYLLNKDTTAKWGYSLLGKDVYTSDAMQEIGAGKTPIYYGDMSGLAIKMSEKINIQVLKERYAEEHMDGILAFVGLDAKLQDSQKIAKMTMAGGSV